MTPLATVSRFRLGITSLLLGALILSASSGGAAAPRRTDESRSRAVAHHPDGRPLRLASVPTRLPRPRLFGVGRTAIEPTIGATKNGDLFYTAFASNMRIDVLRSRNGAKRWDVVSPAVEGNNTHLVSADPYLYVDSSTGRVFTVDLTVACSLLSFTDNRGETWTTNPLACGRPINDHQTLFAGPPVSSPTTAYPNVVYYCFSDLANSACSKSLDGGITFLPTGEPAFAPDVYPDGGPCPGWHGHGTADQQGTIYLPKAHCGAPWLAISHDEGITWDRVRVAPRAIARGGSDPAVAVDARGTVYYLWVGINRLPYLAVSRDKGRTWSRPMMIAAPAVKEANLATVAAGGSGKLAIAYTGSENSLFQECAIGDGCAGEDVEPVTPTWNGYLSITTSALSKHPIFYSARVNRPSDPLVRGACGPGRCSWMLDFIDVQVGPSGDAWATFVDGFVPSGSQSVEGEGLVATFRNAPSLR